MTQAKEGVEAVRAAVAADVERALARLDLAGLQREYREQDEFLFVPDFLPASTVARLLEDVERLEPGLNRNYIPRHKKGGSVSHFAIADGGPAILAFYQSDAFPGRIQEAILKRFSTEGSLISDNDRLLLCSEHGAADSFGNSRRSRAASKHRVD